MFKRWIHTLIYYTRCNHLKHTPLFPCVMFRYCLPQAPVVQKVDNSISIQTEHYPMDSAISFPNTYPLNPVHRPSFEQHELLCSTWVTMMVGKLACTCWQIGINRAYCSLRNEMERNETTWNETKWKSVVSETKWKCVVCEMRTCSLWNENVSFAKWKSAVCEMKICSLRNENLQFAKWQSGLGCSKHG